MISPAGFTEWGYLGALVFIVTVFIAYLIRRDNAQAKREQAQQDFFGSLLEENRGAMASAIRAIQELRLDFQTHDRMVSTAITAMIERTAVQQRKTRPRPKPKTDEE